jgi:GNAT superfamily N-acetyltransferase
MQLVTRLGALQDVPGLARVQRAAALAAFGNIFPLSLPKPTAGELEQEWTVLCEEEDSTVLVAVLDDIVGCAAVQCDNSAPAGVLLGRLYVDPPTWGQGVGGVLHERAISVARRLGFTALNLWVLVGNRQTRGIYEHWGWRVVPGRSQWTAGGSVEEVMYQLDLT